MGTRRFARGRLQVAPTAAARWLQTFVADRVEDGACRLRHETGPPPVEEKRTHGGHTPPQMFSALQERRRRSGWPLAGRLGGGDDCPERRPRCSKAPEVFGACTGVTDLDPRLAIRRLRPRGPPRRRRGSRPGRSRPHPCCRAAPSGRGQAAIPPPASRPARRAACATPSLRREAQPALGTVGGRGRGDRAPVDDVEPRWRGSSAAHFGVSSLLRGAVPRRPFRSSPWLGSEDIRPR